jgi:CRISPR/Cas system-associated endoribonuclease Cas2
MDGYFEGLDWVQNSAFDLTMATGASKFNSLILG